MIEASLSDSLVFFAYQLIGKHGPWLNPRLLDRYPSADIHLDRIGNLLDYDQAAFAKETCPRLPFTQTMQA